MDSLDKARGYTVRIQNKYYPIDTPTGSAIETIQEYYEQVIKETREKLIDETEKDIEDVYGELLGNHIREWTNREIICYQKALEDYKNKIKSILQNHRADKE